MNGSLFWDYCFPPKSGLSPLSILDWMCECVNGLPRRVLLRIGKPIENRLQNIQQFLPLEIMTVGDIEDRGEQTESREDVILEREGDVIVDRTVLTDLEAAMGRTSLRIVRNLPLPETASGTHVREIPRP